MSRPVVFDTVVLSNFASTDAVGVLVDRFENPCTVEPVAAELRLGIEEGYSFLESAVDALGEGIHVITLEAPIGEVAPNLAEAVDSGEAAALYVARRRRGVLASDDAAARHLAETHDVAVTGSIGILADLVSRERVSRGTADDWLERWTTENGYYAPIDSVEEIL